jgi:vacuolar-type H+-ATPase subunit D/Vma8
VLEERLLPGLAADIRATEQSVGEREREEYYRLKRFKTAAHKRTFQHPNNSAQSGTIISCRGPK